MVQSWYRPYNGRSPLIRRLCDSEIPTTKTNDINYILSMGRSGQIVVGGKTSDVSRHVVSSPLSDHNSGRGCYGRKRYGGTMGHWLSELFLLQWRSMLFVRGVGLKSTKFESVRRRYWMRHWVQEWHELSYFVRTEVEWLSWTILPKTDYVKSTFL